MEPSARVNGCSPTRIRNSTTEAAQSYRDREFLPQLIGATDLRGTKFYLRPQSGGLATGRCAQLKLSSTRRIDLGSRVRGFTSLVNSGKCSRIWAAVLIGLPVTVTRAPNTSAVFAEPMTPSRVSALRLFQSTVYAAPSSTLTTTHVCGSFHSTFSTRPSIVAVVHWS